MMLLRDPSRVNTWRDDVYSIRLAPSRAPWLHLAVHRHDGQPIHSWTDLQRIKNELLGPDSEAVELFPAEDRLVDMANEYHLWAVRGPTFPFGEPGFRFPFGMTARAVKAQ